MRSPLSAPSPNGARDRKSAALLRGSSCSGRGTKPQVPPLRCAPVGMAIRLEHEVSSLNLCGENRIVIPTGARSAVEGPAVQFTPISKWLTLNATSHEDCALPHSVHRYSPAQRSNDY